MCSVNDEAHDAFLQLVPLLTFTQVDLVLGLAQVKLIVNQIYITDVIMYIHLMASSQNTISSSILVNRELNICNMHIACSLYFTKFQYDWLCILSILAFLGHIYAYCKCIVKLAKCAHLCTGVGCDCFQSKKSLRI